MELQDDGRPMTDIGPGAAATAHAHSTSRPVRRAMGATYATAVVDALVAVGVQRLFGMPGGGSNADLIEAATQAHLPFSLAHTESASAFMATAQAEPDGRARCVSGDPGSRCGLHRQRCRKRAP